LGCGSFFNWKNNFLSSFFPSSPSFVSCTSSV
jgi:hypothetical protein